MARPHLRAIGAVPFLPADFVCDGENLSSDLTAGICSCALNIFRSKLDSRQRRPGLSLPPPSS
eukprot:283015-Hanusia_phi.AAC.1